MLIGPNKLMTDFFDAARTGNIDELERLIQIPEIVENINAGDSRHSINAALSYAIKNGHVSVVEQLLNFPDVIALVGHHDITLVFEKGRVEIFNHFLTHPQINRRIQAQGLVYTQMASRLGLLDFLNSMLALEGIQERIMANFHAANHGRAIFMHAAQNGHFEIVTRLLQIPNFSQAIDTDPETWLYAAIVNGDLNAIDAAINQDLMQYSWRLGVCLEIAAAMGHLPIVERLLELPLGMGMSQHRHNGFLGAIKKGRIDVVRCLLQFFEAQNREPRHYLQSVIKAAISYGQHEILKLLLAIPSIAALVFPSHDYERYLSNPLERVVERGDPNVTQILLKMPRMIAILGIDGADLVRDYHHPLMALDRGHLEVVNQFLEISDQEALDAWCGLSMHNKLMYGYQQSLSPPSRKSCSPLTRLSQRDLDFQLRVLCCVLDHISVQCPLIAQIDSLGNITNEYAREYPVYAAKLVGKLFNLIQASRINLENYLTPNQYAILLENYLTPNRYAILLDLHPVRHTSMFTRLMEVASPEPTLVEPGAPTSIFNFSRLSSTLRRWCPCRSGEQLELEQDDLRVARNRL